ncbi:hypothetical protein QJS04_geneDACA014788 [Acorus gramineus]|uniref:Uncharacterized protein n=1 Tax=Acorus gramineus TaxID=55184 RepID=A0AAV9BQB8_ACOGR|nr:hypothetical protein QJS04_geneDACA014788 [Acorus gramineus]
MAEPLLVDSEKPKPNPSKPFNKVFIMIISLPLLYYYSIHIPPSTLFKDTKFWFFLSNTIILIVAADSGAFSSSSSSSDAPMDLYDEYLKHRRSREDHVGSFDVVPPKEKPVNLPCQSVAPREKLVNLRCQSENAIVVHQTEKHFLRRSSEMSREELNRRADEFIERINREIRLQQLADDE